MPEVLRNVIECDRVAKETGSATTTIQAVTLAELSSKDKERFILFRAKTEEGQGVPPGISCVDLVPGSGSGRLDTLPMSGGTHPIVLFSSAIFLTLGVAYFSLK